MIYGLGYVGLQCENTYMCIDYQRWYMFQIAMSYKLFSNWNKRF